MIIRVRKNKNYTHINNTVLRDKRLSYKARGIAAFLLTMPDDWEISAEGLEHNSPDGESSVSTGLRELEAAGYLVRQRHRDEQGRWQWNNTLHEEPVTIP